MIEEAQESVGEKLATHKKNGQRYLLICTAVLTVILILDILSSLYDSPAPDEETKAEAMVEPSIQNSVAEFEKYFQRAKKVPHPTEPLSYSDRQTRLQQLKEQRETLIAKAKQQLGGEPTFATDAISKWQEAEKKRVLDSRRSRLEVVFEKKRMEQKPISRNQPFSPVNAISKQRQFLTDEIERVKKLQADLAIGNFSGASSVEAEEMESHIIGGTDENKQIAITSDMKLIQTGTIIHATLDQTVNSDYIGSWRGLITQDVYDPYFKYILIPKGSRVVGKTLRISNVNEPIQARMGLTVNWVVLPGGERIDFRKSAALDETGINAFKGDVNHHFLAQFLGVAAYAMLSAETSHQSSFDEPASFAEDVGASLRHQFAPLASKYLSLVPTITLEQPVAIRIFVEDDIYVRPWRKLFVVNLD